MAYLGRGLDRGNYLKLDDLSSQFNGNTVTFNLTSGGQAFYPGSAYSILVSLAGIIQEPESAYIISNNTITFASPPQGSDDFFCIALGVPLCCWNSSYWICEFNAPSVRCGNIRKNCRSSGHIFSY